MIEKLNWCCTLIDHHEEKQLQCGVFEANIDWLLSVQCKKLDMIKKINFLKIIGIKFWELNIIKLEIDKYYYNFL